MNLLFISAAFLLAATFTVQGAVRTGGSYDVPAEVHDAGGAFSSSSSYRNLGSVGGMGTMVAAADYAFLPGYPAQIQNLPVPTIQVEQPGGEVIPSGGGRDFGVVVLGMTVQLEFTLRNTGSANLEISGLSVDGSHHGEFTAEPEGGILVAPGSTATLTITFTPAGAGPRNAALTFETNAAVKEFTLALTGHGNSAPTFNGYAVATAHETSATISFSKLLSKATDADGHALTVSAAGPVSTGGGAVALQSVSILYVPPAAFSGMDTFLVTVTDAHGASVFGTVTVVVAPAPDSGGQGMNPPQLSLLPGGDVGITFQGIPGRSYHIQRSTNLLDWTTIATMNANPVGAVGFTDEDAPSGSAFYRLAKP